MIRFGYAIRIGGDPEISAALREGMEKGSPLTGARQGSPSGPAGHLPAHGGEALEQRAAGSDTARRLAMMRHTPEEWRQMTEEARVIYGGRRYRPRWAGRLLVGWAMICYGISRAYRAQDKVLQLDARCGRSESAPTEGNAGCERGRWPA